MIFYHGSPIANLTELKPELSEHGKPYVYFATNPLVALLYAVKPVPKPFSYYPYGFDAEGKLIYSDYFKDSFKKLYKGKTGYLYECDDIINAEQPTQISCAYACKNSVKVDRVTLIPDLYEYYRNQEEAGLFTIRRFDEIPDKEMTYVLNDMKKTINKYDLKNFSENPMSVFIKKYFSEIL